MRAVLLISSVVLVVFSVREVLTRMSKTIFNVIFGRVGSARCLGARITGTTSHFDIFRPASP